MLGSGHIVAPGPGAFYLHNGFLDDAPGRALYQPGIDGFWVTAWLPHPSAVSIEVAQATPHLINVEFYGTFFRDDGNVFDDYYLGSCTHMSDGDVCETPTAPDSFGGTFDVEEFYVTAALGAQLEVTVREAAVPAPIFTSATATGVISADVDAVIGGDFGACHDPRNGVRVPPTGASWEGSGFKLVSPDGAALSITFYSSRYGGSWSYESITYEGPGAERGNVPSQVDWVCLHIADGSDSAVYEFTYGLKPFPAATHSPHTTSSGDCPEREAWEFLTLSCRQD